MWGSAATEPPGGGFGRGVPLPQKFCNFRYWKSCFNAEKNQKKRKIATCEGAQRPNLLGVGFWRGVPPPAENFAILGTENHVLMHFSAAQDDDFFFFFFFFFFFKNVKIRGNPRIRGGISCLSLPDFFVCSSFISLVFQLCLSAWVMFLICLLYVPELCLTVWY